MARSRDQAESQASAPCRHFVPSNKVGKVIGRRGAMIRELQGKSGADIDVTDTQLEDGTTLLNLSGTPECIELARRLIDKTIEASRSPQKAPVEREFCDEFEIPEDKCGLVIGARGSKIREIQADTGASVNVGSRDSAINGLILVCLTGDEVGCGHARNIIFELIADVGEEGPATSSSSVKLEIPADMTRKLIGPGGATIRNIQDKSDAQVDVARRNTAVDGMVTVTVTGSEEACDRATDLINRLVSESSHPAETIQMEICESMCGLIIGSRGAKIRSIQDDTGASIKIDKRNEARDGKVQVTITGSVKDCTEARDVIEGIIADSLNKDTERPAETHRDHAIELWVPESCCGMIIGRGGSKIQDIQNASNTRVDVHSRERNADGMCLVAISGGKDDCEHAREIVEDIVSDEQNRDRDRERGDRGDRGRGDRDRDREGPATDRGSMEIWVRTRCLGKIIGRGGMKIRDIERQNKVKIDVRKDTVDKDETSVLLIGLKPDVMKTRDLVFEIVDEDEQEEQL